MQKVLRKIRQFFLPVAFIFIATSFTGAFYSDRVSVTNNSFTAGTWETSETQSQKAQPGDVVINELMWMGSTQGTQDEWIELRNMTSSSIDISSWEITGIPYGENAIGTLLSIPEKASIPGNGYFLISRKSKDVSAINVDPDLVSNSAFLSNSRLELALYSGSSSQPTNLVDKAGLGSPLIGDSSIKISMSRNESPGDGTLASSWFLSTNNSTTYWDVADGNFGTPGGSNE